MNSEFWLVGGICGRLGASGPFWMERRLNRHGFVGGVELVTKSNLGRQNAFERGAVQALKSQAGSAGLQQSNLESIEAVWLTDISHSSPASPTDSPFAQEISGFS